MFGLFLPQRGALFGLGTMDSTGLELVLFIFCFSNECFCIQIGLSETVVSASRLATFHPPVHLFSLLPGLEKEEGDREHEQERKTEECWARAAIFNLFSISQHTEKEVRLSRHTFHFLTTEKAHPAAAEGGARIPECFY